jgi:hypothetical protein
LQATKVTFSEDVTNDKKIKSYNRRIKLANYDGTGEWRDYKSHFDACAAINDWDDEEKGLYLAAALRGQAQCVLGDLPDLRLLNPTAATKNYVTCRGLHVTGVIRFVPELLLWIQVTLCISCF